MEPGTADGSKVTRTAFGQRRYITVLFSDVSGSSEHAERLEAEEYAELLERFRAFARDIIPRHGGSIARMQGDGVLALFGHLEPGEDDGQHAVEATLALHAAVAQLRAGTGASATQLQLHSGIHAGLVLLIDGDIERGRYDVVGEVPNTAARLCSMASSGEILVSEETLGPRAHFFQFTATGTLAIRGRSKPLNAMRIGGLASVERRIDAAARRGVVPFVGRAPVMATLQQAALRAQAGESAVLVVSGEPGIGKTRLIDEFQNTLDRTHYCVVQGYCENHLGAEPLQPYKQGLRGALGWRAGAAADDNEAAVQARLQALDPGNEAGLQATAQALGVMQATATPPGNSPSSAPAPLRAPLIIRMLGLLARERTLVLIMDDWQWADDASRQALQDLLSDATPVLVVLGARTGADEDASMASGLRLSLQPLEAEAAESAIAAWLPGANRFVAEEIYRQSGGSPLFIEELCHAAAASGGMAAVPRGSGVAWINALVVSRLSRLPAAEVEALRVASVAGTVFPTWLLERLVGAASTRLLESLAMQDFLVPAGHGGMLRFKHALTREAVYATVDLLSRRALHLQVAESLEAAVGHEEAFDWLEALSYHYDAAGKALPAAQYAEAAGDKALAAMALDRARAHYMTALRALDALPGLDRETMARWCAIAQRLGQTCVFDVLDVADGLRMFERAAQLARELRNDNAIARAEYWLAYVNYGKGQARRAVRHCEQALVHAQASHDARLVAQVKATLGQSLASAGRYSEALPLLTEAVESKRQQSRPGSGAAIGSAYTLARKGYTLGDLGRFDEAHAHFAEALQLLGEHLHAVRASILELKCAVYLWQGRWAEAEAAGLEGSDIALRCRSRFNTVMGQALSACAGWAERRDMASLQVLRDATQWIEVRGGAISTSLNYGWLVEAAVSLGQEDQMRKHAARLFSRARVQDRHGQAQGCRALARMAATQGDARRAEHYLGWARQVADFRNSRRERALNLLTQAEMAALLRRPANARTLAHDAAGEFDAMKMAWHLNRALTVPV